MSSSGLLPESKEELIVKASPSSLEPLSQAVVNRNFFGAKIYKETNKFNPYDNKPEFKKANKATPKILVNISQDINKALGGDDYHKADNVLNNPSLWNHLIEGYFSGFATLGKQIMKTTEDIEEGDLKFRNIPVVNRFVRNMDEYPTQSKVYDQYMYYIDKYERDKSSLNDMRKDLANGNVLAQDFAESLLKSQKDYYIIMTAEAVIKKYKEALKTSSGEQEKKLKAKIEEVMKDAVKKMRDNNE
jgi:hypothetical protein